MTEPIQLVSVTSVLGVIGNPDGLVGWAANRVADDILDVVRQAIDYGAEILEDLKADAGADKSTMSMRNQAEAEAWRSLGFVREYRADPAKARYELAGARFRPDLDPATNLRYELSSGGLGTAFHDAADRWTLTGTRPDAHFEVKPLLDQYERWLDIHQPEPILAEYTGINLTSGYAGRGDLVAKINFGSLGRVVCAIDYKTTRKSFARRGRYEVETTPRPSAGIQLAAYRGFEHVVRWDQSMRLEKNASGKGARWYMIDDEDLAVALPMPETVGGVVLHVTPDHCTSHEVNHALDEWASETWLYYLECARRELSQKMSQLIGPAQAPPSGPSYRTPEVPS